MADDYGKIKLTPEYDRAKEEVEGLIQEAVEPLKFQLAEMTAAFQALEKRLRVLEARLPNLEE